MKIVIGYGSPLHSDDAAGRLVAEAVAAWQRPDVLTIAATQLLPEHAAALADAELAIFVDAIDDPNSDGCTIERVGPSTASTRPASNHFYAPAGLLALTQTLFNAAPLAYVVAIPGRNFGLGLPPHALSSTTAHGIATALWAVRGLCDHFNPS